MYLAAGAPFGTAAAAENTKVAARNVDTLQWVAVCWPLGLDTDPPLVTAVAVW